MMAKTFISKQFFHFLVAGGIAACINFSVGFVLAGLVPLHGDIVVGYLAGMLTAFFIFEKVFGEHSESREKSVQIFILVNLLGLVQTWVVYVILKDYLFPGINYHLYAAEMARAIAIIVPLFSSFIGHKFFTFKQ